MLIEQIKMGITWLCRQLKTLFFVLLLFGFYTPTLAITSLTVMAIHEGGHILSLHLLGKKTGRFRRRFNGFVMACDGGLSYREEIVVAASGPSANLLTALLSLFFLPLAGGFVLDFCALSLLTALFNLLPLEGNDGERILTALLSSHISFDAVFKIKRALSLLLTVLFLFLSVYLLYEQGQGYFIFGVFFFSLLSFIGSSRICEKMRF